MGIDRIGKGGGVAPPIPTSRVSTERLGQPSATEAARTFRPEASANVATAQVTPLDRFRSGEIDINGYLDLKVELATLHLEGLSVSEMTAVRKMLREHLATDPALADLVQHATGRAPTVPEDD
jgi:hypothetical protein